GATAAGCARPAPSAAPSAARRTAPSSAGTTRAPPQCACTESGQFRGHNLRFSALRPKSEIVSPNFFLVGIVGFLVLGQPSESERPRRGRQLVHSRGRVGRDYNKLGMPLPQKPV